MTKIVPVPKSIDDLHPLDRRLFGDAGVQIMTPTDRITPAMLRELKSIATTGEPTDPIEWHGANALWFHARDRVIGALDRRGLIAATPDWTVTDAGRAAIAKAVAK